MKRVGTRSAPVLTGVLPSEGRGARGRLLRWVLWFQLGNTLLLSILGLRYFSTVSLPTQVDTWVFLACMVPAHFALLTTALLPLTILPALVLPHRWVLPWGVVLFSLLATLVSIDTYVFSLYRFHLNGVVWGILVSGVASEILPLSGRFFLQAGLLFVGILAVEAALAWLALRVRDWARPPLGRVLAASLILMILVGHGMHAWAHAHLDTSITQHMRRLPWIRALTAYGFLERRGWVAANFRPTRPIHPRDSGLSYPLSPVVCHPAEIRPNLLIVAIEQWRFDELNPVTTPHIWDFSLRNLRLTHHFSSGNGSRDGIFGLMYGILPSYWNAMQSENRGSVLIDEAIRQGYRFGIFGSASLIHPEFDRTVFAALRGRIDLRTEGASAAERDRRITDKLLTLLDDGSSSPFFAFLFYDSPHSLDHPKGLEVPYKPVWEVVNRLELNADFDPTPYRNRNRNSLYYVDQLVDEVLSALESRRLLESTIVVITGDHGEEFNDTNQNYWGHGSNFSRYQTQVPMVIHWPGREPEVRQRMTSHLDLVPTLMEHAFGCTTPVGQYSNGFDLFGTEVRSYVVVGQYQRTGIVDDERITLLEWYGDIRVSDHALRDLGGAAPDPVALQEVAEGAGRFYAR